MPNWKKVAVSGSAASFSSLHVDTSVTASVFSGSEFIGNLSGTASYAITASYALNGGSGNSALYISDKGVFQGTASYLDFTGAGVSATVASGTASINIPGGAGGDSSILNQSIAAATWSFNHSLGTLYPVFTIYDSNDNVIVPQQIHAQSTSSALIYFSSPRTGTAVASKGGSVSTGSNAVFTQPTPATTWVFNHYLNDQFPVFQVFNASNEVIIPTSITANSTTTATISFNVPTAGTAVASIGGYTGSNSIPSSSFAITASYAFTASYAVSASRAISTLNADTASYVVLAQTASYVATASYATTASHAEVFTIGGSQMMYSNTPSTSAGNNGIFATDTGSFAGVFYQYTLYSGSNARSENATAVWTTTTSSYTNYSTIDVGDTSGVISSVVITGGQIQLNLFTPTAGWTVRAVATFV